MSGTRCAILAVAPRILLGVSLVSAGLSCGDDGGDIGPTPSGSLEITTATSGAEPDGDGYAVKIDGGTETAIGTNASLRQDNLEPGNHTVLLTGVAGNCAVSGENPRAVTITAGATAIVAFVVDCPTPPTDKGSLQVRTTTTNPGSEPDGYVFRVDGNGTQPIGPNTSVTVSNLALGPHVVELLGVSGNCTLEGSNPRDVTVSSGETAEVAFSLTCVPLGTPITYQVTELDFFPSKINDVGHIAGIRGTFQEEQHLIIWKDGAATDLGVLDYNSYVTGFNVHDVIVGWSQTRTEHFRGWMWDGTMHDLGDFQPEGIDDNGRIMGYTPQGGEFRSSGTSVPVGCSLGGLNNRGQITGTYEFDTPEGGIRSNVCVWDNGTFRDLGVSLSEGGPTDINDLGLIVGVHDNGFVYRSFVVQDGVMTELPNLGGTNAAEAINDAGIAVGWSDEVFNSDLYVAHPVIWENGVISRLPGEFGGAADINNSGQIVGSIGPTNDGPWTGVLWTPSEAGALLRSSRR
jgi:hypothetical protein